MLEAIGSGILLIAVLVLVLSPLKFWRIWDNVTSGEPVFQMVDLEVPYPVGRIVSIVNDEAQLAADERSLKLARDAQARATSDWAKKHWWVVEQHLLRDMKWRATSALTNGSEYHDGFRSSALSGSRLQHMVSK